MRLNLAIAVATAALLAPAAGARAQDDGQLQLSLNYEGRLIFHVLDIEVTEHATTDAFTAESNLTSAGILAALKHIHQHAASRGRIVGGDPEPGVFETQSLSGKTRRRVRAVWDGREVDTAAEPAYSNLGDPPPTPQQKLAASDPLTTLVRITMKGSRETTCDRSYLFFDGKQLYALDFGPPLDAPLSGKEQQLGLTGHFRCDVRFREVAGFNRKPANKRNQGLQHPVRVDFAQFGEHGPWVISGLHADTPLGRASIELSRLSVAGGASG
jgi:hypothetical protein